MRSVVVPGVLMSAVVVWADTKDVLNPNQIIGNVDHRRFTFGSVVGKGLLYPS